MMVLPGWETTAVVRRERTIRQVLPPRTWISWALVAWLTIVGPGAQGGRAANEIVPWPSRPRTSMGGAPAAQNPGNSDAALVQDFEQRIGEYVNLHKSAEAKLPNLKKPTKSQEKIERHKHGLRRAIIAQRAGVGEGNIFTPRIAAEFRRLIGMAYHADSRPIRESLQSSEPGTANLRIRVNTKYPDGEPLQTMPPSLLLSLPQLPSELEYRIVGRDLVLRDMGANLIVDILRGVIPQ